MISCTEFIPLYSEVFKYLEKKGGHDEVMEFWYYLSDHGIGDKTNPNSLISFIERDGGFEGAVHYWEHTLSEEASDVLKIHDFEKRYSYTHMRHCPSRGMLNALEHIEPYYDYCEHCNVIYNRVLDKYGIAFDRDNSKVDHAECFSLLYEKGNKPDCDYTAIDDTKVVVDMKAEDNKYLHRDFHIFKDMALSYCGEKFGKEEVISFLKEFTRNFYAPQIEKVRKCGLEAMKEWIEHTYAVEEAEDVLHTELSEHSLTVVIDKCPVIAYMHSLNQTPSEYVMEETGTLYQEAADLCGLLFEMEYYKDNGATKFTFTVPVGSRKE